MLGWHSHTAHKVRRQHDSDTAGGRHFPLSARAGMQWHGARSTHAPCPRTFLPFLSFLDGTSTGSGSTSFFAFLDFRGSATSSSTLSKACTRMCSMDSRVGATQGSAARALTHAARCCLHTERRLAHAACGAHMHAAHMHACMQCPPHLQHALVRLPLPRPLPSSTSFAAF